MGVFEQTWYKHLLCSVELNQPLCDNALVMILCHSLYEWMTVKTLSVPYNWEIASLSNNHSSHVQALWILQ